VEESKSAMTNPIVLDASLAVSWCIQDEQTEETEEILDSFAGGFRALVPALWLWEVNNILLVAERRGRLTYAKRKQQIAILRSLPIEIDEDAAEHTWSDTNSLARTYGLTVYDASYLELALRLGIPLGSLDSELRTAATKKASVKCLPRKL
jgi:predicted nucleic acid-binding protein